MPLHQDGAAPHGEKNRGEQAPSSLMKVRQYRHWIVAVLGALGVLSAVGTQVIDWSFATAGERIHPEKPLLIAVREDPHGGADGFHLAARSSTGLDAKLRGTRDCDVMMREAKAAGAVDIYKVTEYLTVEGGSRHDVSIVDMRARILKRESPLSSALITCASAGASGGIGILFNLDEQQPRALKLTDGDALSTAGAYFDHGDIINLTKSETQGFEVVGVSRRSYVEWEIEADVVIDGEETTLTIRNHGQPFRVTAPRNEMTGYGRYYEYQWYESPPRMFIGERSPMP